MKRDFQNSAYHILQNSFLLFHEKSHKIQSSAIECWTAIWVIFTPILSGFTERINKFWTALNKIKIKIDLKKKINFYIQYEVCNIYRGKHLTSIQFEIVLALPIEMY